jgi:hypothetical protein
LKILSPSTSTPAGGALEIVQMGRLLVGTQTGVAYLESGPDKRTTSLNAADSVVVDRNCFLSPTDACDVVNLFPRYSHAGGSSGSRWLSVAAATSLAQSASMTVVEFRSTSAIHSEILRRGAAGGETTATIVPSWSSMKTFPPAHVVEHPYGIAENFAF